MVVGQSTGGRYMVFQGRGRVVGRGAAVVGGGRNGSEKRVSAWTGSIMARRGLARRATRTLGGGEAPRSTTTTGTTRPPATATGIRTSTLVPDPGRDSTLTSPRVSRTRSSMLRSPKSAARALAGDESDAVVDDAQLDVLAGRHQPHLDRPRARVADGVGQRFLRHAEQAERHVGLERVELVAGV